MSKALRQNLSALAIVFAASVLAFLAVRYLSPLANLEKRVADIRIAAMQPPRPASDQVMVVAIDEATISSFPYRSPVDRGFIADLINKLDAKGAKAIAVDVLIDQATEQTKDDALKAAIANAKTPLAFSFTSTPNVVDEAQLAYMQDFVPVKNRAEANLLTDPFDGSVRKINPGGEIIKGKRVDTPLHPAGFVRKLAGMVGVQAPLEPVEIAWRARPDAENQPFPVVSANYVKYLPDEMFRGKIVLIGAVLSITDRHLTPLAIIDDGDQGRMPGIFVQAHGLTQVLEGRSPPSVPLSVGISLAVLMAALGVGISLFKRGIVFNLGVGLVVLAACWVGAVIGYGHGFPMVPLISPSLAFVFAIWMMDVFIGRGERKQREFVQGTFSRYVSPEVVKQLVSDPTSVMVTGSKQEATFIFTDVAGFTTLSERLTAEKLSDVLNEYLDGACTIIQKYQGTIDKFIGDAIMSIFNAPLPQPDHPERAVRCALELDAYAEAFRIEQNAQDVPIGVTRIGVHTGESVIGNFGSQSRMDFTALGDTVNTAARTEGVNKYFGTRICCTSETVERCPDLKFRPIGDIVLKGKLTATTLYTPVAASDDPALIAGYDAAYAALKAQEPGAAAAFEILGEAFPEDPVVQFHLGRIAKGLVSTNVIMEDK